MGGGFGTQFEGVGSNLTIINLEETTKPGKLLESVYYYNQKLTPPSSSRVLDIEDLVATRSSISNTLDELGGVNFWL